MAYRAVPRKKRPEKTGPAVKVANSPSSSTTSSSRLPPEVASVDEQSSPASSSAKSKPVSHLESPAADSEASKENVTVTVRFRPLSPREIRQGEEIAWYADGDTIVRSENWPSVAYAYDRVFGPTTTTRHVYDVAAQHIVSGAMDGVNGTIFAYGVTSSGKTHTMHGDQRSPGIIPLAVKDAFSIIQETPTREFLLRVSYLEIYNEVVNDLLNPAGQNLRIREDLQGTFVEGIKEEVVLSPAHALSLIAAGEEHRHVGSTNFNLLSSRSHTIFTLTIESTPCGNYNEGEAVNLSQLNLIDLAGSESSRAETTGLRRKEGAYINKSLLTLGTVISKLTEERAAHVPYRDSKLTRLLQSSLSGQGRVSLICTVTPASSNAEETHNTLKFAHRAKCIEILASQNKIIDEKSLIKKYQSEIRCLKEELDQLKKGMVSVNTLKDNGGDDIVLLKQKLEDGHVKLQSRLEQEEEAKAALLGRIQRLTKLILVSTKATHSPWFHQRPVPRRRHSFGEEELSYLPFRRRDMILDHENNDFFAPLEEYGETDYPSKEEKRNRKPGLLNWFKLKKRDSAVTSSDGDKSSGTKSLTTPSTPQADFANLPSEPRISISLRSESFPVDPLAGSPLNGDLTSENVSLQETPPVEMRNDSEEMKVKSQEMALDKHFADFVSVKRNHEKLDISPSYTALIEQLNEKSFELEVKTADNRVIQDQLHQKNCECEELQEMVTSLKHQLFEVFDRRNASSTNSVQYNIEEMNLHELLRRKESFQSNESNSELQQAHPEIEMEDLKQELLELKESKSNLEVQNQKLVEESQYAKGLASAAGVELKALLEEVTKRMNDNERLTNEMAKLMNDYERLANELAKQMNHNERLTNELALLKNSPQRKPINGQRLVRGTSHVKRHDLSGKKPPNTNTNNTNNNSDDRVIALQSALMDKERREAELQKEVEEYKRKDASLENELANMWILMAKLKKPREARKADLDDE